MGNPVKMVFWRALMQISALCFAVGIAVGRFAHIRISRALFKPRPDDIFIATYPKSGTTLMQMILHQLKTDGQVDFAHINNVSPYLELEFQQSQGRFLDRFESPRVFKTHLTADVLPVETGRYIYILRDARDVAVSAFHHTRLMGGMERTLEEFTENFLSSKKSTQRAILGAGTVSWFEHLESWWPHRNRPNVLCLSYETMIVDLEGTVRKVADFCGFPLREEDMPRILANCSLAAMKQHEEKFDPRFQFSQPGSQGFIRQGKAGSGREHTPRHQQIFEQRLTELAEKLGCPASNPYEEIRTALDKS
jgi:hypothetical protein